MLRMLRTTSCLFATGCLAGQPRRHAGRRSSTAKLILLMLAVCPSLALGAGWTQPEGAAYAKLTYRGLLGAAAFDTEGEIFDLPESFSDHAVNLYAEMGLRDNLTLIVLSNPFGIAASGDESTTYVGRSAVGLRAGRAFGSTRLAVEARYGFAPDIGETSVATGTVGDRAYTYVPTVQTQSYTGELQVGQPLSFGWLAASLGILGYSRAGLDPVLTGFGQLGWNMNETMTLEMRVNVHEVLGEVDVINVAGAGQTRYLGIGFGYSWWFAESVALTAAFEGAPYAESNAGTPSLNLGFEYRGQLWDK